jgi:hypothetical protein
MEMTMSPLDRIANKFHQLLAKRRASIPLTPKPAEPQQREVLPIEQRDPLWFEKSPSAPEPDKGFVDNLVELAVDKIAPLPKLAPDVTIGRSFSIGHNYSEEERDWIRAWHENEKFMRLPGYDLRAILGIALDENSDWKYLKTHDYSYAAYLCTLIQRGADPAKIKQMMDQKVAQLKRHHRVLNDNLV